MNDQQQHFTLHPQARFRTIAGEGVIIQQETGQAVVVNGIGARILTLLSDGLDSAEIVARLDDEYALGDAPVEQHVAHYLAELQSVGVIAPVTS